MKVLVPHKVDKYLERRQKSDPKNIARVKKFLSITLSQRENPTLLSNCKKMKGMENTWRWRVGDYRIVAEVMHDELLIHVIRIAHRQEVYKDF